MPVPEAAVNKHNGAILRQDDIGLAEKPLPRAQPEPEAKPMQHRSHDSFRCGVA